MIKCLLQIKGICKTDQGIKGISKTDQGKRGSKSMYKKKKKIIPKY